MKNIFFGAILPLLLVAAGFALLFGLRRPEPPQKALPDPSNPAELLPFVPRADVATVYDLKSRSETLNIEVNGTVVPYREVQIAAEVSGRVIEKNPEVRSGNDIEKGQLLYRIDPSDYELDVAALEQRRDQETAAVNELAQDIANSNDLLALADEQLKLAEGEVSRLEQMNKNFSSAAELDAAQKSRLTALNAKVTLRNQIRTYEARRERLKLAIRLAETELERARLDLARTEIRAPISGRIVSENVEEDSIVQQGTPMLVIEDTSKVEVASNIRMEQLYWILDQPTVSTDAIVNADRNSRSQLPPTPVDVKFTVAGRYGETYVWKGLLDRYGGSGLDPESRTVPILIQVDEPTRLTREDGAPVDDRGPPRLVRGMYVDVTIKAKPSQGLMLVPKLSVKPASNASVIWKFTPNPEALFKTPAAQAALAKQKTQASQPRESLAKQDEAATENTVQKVDPKEWEVGFLEVIEGVRMVSNYWDNNNVEYWICEVPAGKLSPGDHVITTPLPGIRADGTDPIRVRRSELEPDDVAKTSRRDSADSSKSAAVAEVGDTQDSVSRTDARAEEGSQLMEGSERS